MVAQDDGLVAAQRRGDPAALLGVVGHAGVLLVAAVVLVEGAGVLGEGFEALGGGGQGLAVHGVAVGGADDVRAGLVDGGVDREGRTVDAVAALDDLAVVVDEQQVADLDVLEGDAEGVDPEVVGELGVAGGDVAGDALLEAEAAEDAQRGGGGVPCGGGVRGPGP